MWVGTVYHSTHSSVHMCPAFGSVQHTSFEGLLRARHCSGAETDMCKTQTSPWEAQGGERNLGRRRLTSREMLLWQRSRAESKDKDQPGLQRSGCPGEEQCEL